MTNKSISRQLDASDRRCEDGQTLPSPDFPDREDFPADAGDATPLELDDNDWDAFLPDDEELDPLPEPGDFWIEFDQLARPPLAA